MHLNAQTIPDVERYRVAFDGHELAFCYEADDEQGYALIDVVNVPEDAGRPVQGVDIATGEPVTVRIPRCDAPRDWRTYFVDENPQQVRLSGVVTIQEIP